MDVPVYLSLEDFSKAAGLPKGVVSELLQNRHLASISVGSGKTKRRLIPSKELQRLESVLVARSSRVEVLGHQEAGA